VDEHVCRELREGRLQCLVSPFDKLVRGDATVHRPVTITHLTLEDVKGLAYGRKGLWFVAQDE